MRRMRSRTAVSRAISSRRAVSVMDGTLRALRSLLTASHIRYKIPVFNEKASRPRPNWHPPYTTGTICMRLNDTRRSFSSGRLTSPEDHLTSPTLSRHSRPLIFAFIHLSHFHSLALAAEPDVSMHELHDDDAYVVLASDGLWATTDNEDVASLIEAHERSTRLSLTPGWLKHAKGTHEI